MVGLCVLAGNIVRNSVLIAFEGAGHPLAPWAHNALGLLVLAVVCAAIARLMVPVRPAPELFEQPIAGLITTQGGRRVDTVL
jgi:exosortase/archaeosortase family protein